MIHSKRVVTSARFFSSVLSAGLSVQAMKCPYCGQLDNRVIDSRLNKDKAITRRRRHCDACDQRFTTYERIEMILPMLVKKDGRREAWDRGLTIVDQIVTGS